MSTKHPIELQLIPAPGSKPEFLSSMEFVNDAPGWFTAGRVSTDIVLENYTRDDWAKETSTKWFKTQWQATDTRQKLPGFVNYLRQRQKYSFGRFIIGDKTFILVISPKQASSSTITCRVAPLDTIPNCPLHQLSSPSSNSLQQRHLQGTNDTSVDSKSTSSSASASASAAASKRKKSGLLGNLVGAQNRTNQHLKTLPSKNSKSSTSTAGSATSTAVSSDTNPAVPSSQPQQPTKTPGEVLSDFRRKMEEKFLDFDISPDEVLKVKIELATELAPLSMDDKQSGRVTMEILKYIVYEQAEEVNEEWIAHKEPSEFMDEATIAIYKEGAAPPEVIEEINKADLPEEIRGQQRAIAEQRQKQATKAHFQNQEQIQKQALREENDANDGAVAALNTNKRDRRTIEEIQREVNKRPRN